MGPLTKAVVTALAAAAIPALTLAGVAPLVPGKACERTRTVPVALSDAPPPLRLTVRATGPSCARARIMVTLSAGARRRWTEQAYLSAVESGRSPDEPGPEVTFEHVIAVVEHWTSVEPTSSAPPWPEGATALPATSGTDITQYETKLPRDRYLSLRGAGGRMLCVPQGPESAHCLAIDPASRKVVEFFARGV